MVNFRYRHLKSSEATAPIDSSSLHANAESRFTVLIVDDSPFAANTLSELIGDCCNVLLANNGPDALEIAKKSLPDLILLDVVMPEMDGYEVLRALRADALTSEISVIFITGLDGPQHEARCLHMGGSDYLCKPVNPDILLARVGVHLRLSAKRQQLEAMANFDALTGIANRRYFDIVMETEFRRASRSNLPLTVAMLDIDHFKLYNDYYGHVEGDKAICAVAQVLRDGVRRPGDLVARYGGEEFGLILPGTDEPKAVELLEQLRCKLGELAIPHVSSKSSCFLSISGGIAMQILGSEETAESLVRRADRQLYRAKSTGRNRVATEND